MQQKYKVQYSDAAVMDIDEMFSYIASDNINAATKMANRLDIAIENLKNFPEIGAVLNKDDFELIKGGYRFIIVEPYLVFYRISNNRIIVYRILHSRRDYIKELFWQEN